MTSFLPLGSIVMVKGIKKPALIYGRLQIAKNNRDEVFDYVACPYPEGNISASSAMMFNHNQIETVIFVGYQDDKEVAFRKTLVKAKVERGK